MEQIKQLLSKNSIWLVFILLSIAMTFLSPTFLTVTNITNLFVTNSIVGIMAVGVSFTILSKGIDLSTAGVMALSSVVSASVVQEIGATNKIFEGMYPWPAGAALLLGLAVGVIFGLINGLLIAYTKIPPFIATLGSMLVTRAVALLYTTAFPVPNLSEGFRTLGRDAWVLGIPNIVLVFFVILAIGGFLLSQTRFGKNVYAIGGNNVAARVAGINVEKNIIFIYMFSSICAALAGALFASRVGSGNANFGLGFELNAIAAATIGGVSHSGGIGRISGVLAGILVLGVVNNGMLLLGISPYIQDIVLGTIIVGAVIFDMRRHAKKKLKQILII